MLETRFDVIILTEIGARNITTIQYIMNGYNFYYVIPENNFYGGVGIFVHNNIFDVCVMDERKIGKSCHCPRCENESIILKFTYCKTIVGGIYRYPSGNVKHFVSDLEVCPNKIPDGISPILAGNINIDFIKYNNEETVQFWIDYIMHHIRHKHHHINYIRSAWVNENIELGNANDQMNTNRNMCHGFCQW